MPGGLNKKTQRMLRYRDMRATGCHQSAKLHIFPYPTGLPLCKTESQDITIRVGFGMHQSILLSYHLHFVLHYVISIYQRQRRTDRRTDRQTSCS